MRVNVLVLGFVLTVAGTFASAEQRLGIPTWRFVLELAGANVGSPNQIDGADAQPATVLTVHAGSAMSNDFYAWVKTAVDGEQQRKRGAIIALNDRGQSAWRRSFSDGLIAEITFPTADAASTNTGALLVKVTGNFGPVAKGASEQVVTPRTTPQNFWATQNFRLEIDGIDCRRVSRVETSRRE